MRAHACAGSSLGSSIPPAHDTHPPILLAAFVSDVVVRVKACEDLGQYVPVSYVMLEDSGISLARIRGGLGCIIPPPTTPVI